MSNTAVKSSTNRWLWLPLLICPSLILGSPGESRDKFKHWLDTEKAISKEKEEWNSRKAWLGEHISLTEREILALKEKIQASREKSNASDKERLELLDQETELQKQQNWVREVLVKVEARLIEIRLALPEPLQKDLELAYQKVPSPSTNTKVGLAERLQVAVGILGDIYAFDKKITVTESLHKSFNGEEHLVTVLYLGLGQAYYVGAHDAGTGRPAPKGWQWESQPELKPRIRKAIEMAQGNTGEIVFVDLPVRLKNQEGGNNE